MISSVFSFFLVLLLSVSIISCQDLPFGPVAFESGLHSWQGIWGSNFNETIFFCNFRPFKFEDNTATPPTLSNQWGSLPVLALSDDNGRDQYEEHGATLTGGIYQHVNNSYIWLGLGASANGPYETSFAMSINGQYAYGWYNFTQQGNQPHTGNPNAPGNNGFSGPWVLYRKGRVTENECDQVFRQSRPNKVLAFEQEDFGKHKCNPFVCNNPGFVPNDSNCGVAFTTTRQAQFTPSDARYYNFPDPDKFVCTTGCYTVPCY